MQRIIAFGTVTLCALLFAPAACTSSGHIDLSVAASVSRGSTQVAPPASSQLLVVVEQVEVHVAVDEAGEADEADEADEAGEIDDADEVDDAGEIDDADEADDGEVGVGEDDGWATIFVGPRQLDLFDLQTTHEFLGGSDVPAGKITQIRLVLAPEATLVEDGLERALTCPSCSQTGIKVVTRGKLEIAAGDRLDLLLDFTQTLDAERARLAPVIVASAR